MDFEKTEELLAENHLDKNSKAEII